MVGKGENKKKANTYTVNFHTLCILLMEIYKQGFNLKFWIVARTYK